MCTYVQKFKTCHNHKCSSPVASYNNKQNIMHNDQTRYLVVVINTLSTFYHNELKVKHDDYFFV